MVTKPPSPMREETWAAPRLITKNEIWGKREEDGAVHIIIKLKPKKSRRVRHRRNNHWLGNRPRAAATNYVTGIAVAWFYKACCLFQQTLVPQDIFLCVQLRQISSFAVPGAGGSMTNGQKNHPRRRQAGMRAGTF